MLGAMEVYRPPHNKSTAAAIRAKSVGKLASQRLFILKFVASAF